MSVVLLVRHGQASFGAANYDALSPVGHEQARVLGRALAERGLAPARLVRGEMVRHRETAEGLIEGLGIDVPVEVDNGWDEFDFHHVIDVSPDTAALMAELPTAADQRALFQRVFETATARWIGGEHDEGYHESFPAFRTRVLEALTRAADAAGAAEAPAGPTIVVSSGGPIAIAAADLLGAGTDTWARLNKMAVNTAVTKVISGRSGLALSSYNEQSHLEHDRRLLTYR